MHRSVKFARHVAFLVVGSVALPALAAEELECRHENVMGTSLELRVRAESESAARLAEERVLAEIRRLSAVFSGYDASSEFSRWQSTSVGPVKVSPELLEVLRASDRWNQLSQGAFDPRVEVLSRLWKRCAGEARLPTSEETDEALLRMKQPAWRLDAVTGTAERLSDAPLSLNAIAKGYIVEKACDAALDRSRGVLGLVLNVGGDLWITGEISERVGIADPRADSESSEPVATIEVKDRAVSTSGRHQRGHKIQGRWYSHIFDPRTGLPAEAVLSASVIAPRSLDADALATTLNVLPPEEGLKLAEGLPDVECLILAADGRTFRTEGWRRYERTRTTTNQSVAVAELSDQAKSLPGSSWAEGFELVVDFEINKPPGGDGPYRRPYIAIWVEDAKGFAVRNLVLWLSQGGSGPFQWLPELRRWYRAEKARKLVAKSDMVMTISRPTRPPGRYSVIWDGKDDQGKLVPDGPYTLFIDAAREHGTYQTLRKSMDLTGKPFVEELKGNVEVKSATVSYRRRKPVR
jgi:thiamine biosynthesis lipoprotein ApbE